MTQAPNTPQGQQQAQVLQLFTTPVVVAMLPGAEAINSDLKARILEHEQANETTDHSNLGGWQSSWDMEGWGGAALDKVLSRARGFANQMTIDRNSGQPVNPDWRINVWANVNRQHHANEFHTHPGAYWSGTYYVDDGGIADNPELGGQFEIQDPRGVAPVMYAPNLCFNIPSGPSLGASELLSPRAGLMVLFPSWLQHQVRPYKGEATRISIAFNLSLPAGS